jgi:hypothetical protein
MSTLHNKARAVAISLRERRETLSQLAAETIDALLAEPAGGGQPVAWRGVKGSGSDCKVLEFGYVMTPLVTASSPVPVGVELETSEEERREAFAAADNGDRPHSAFTRRSLRDFDKLLAENAGLRQQGVRT